MTMIYTPDDRVMEGEVESGHRYGEKEFNKIIEIEEREKKRVDIFMDQINQRKRRWSSAPRRITRWPSAISSTR